MCRLSCTLQPLHQAICSSLRLSTNIPPPLWISCKILRFIGVSSLDRKFRRSRLHGGQAQSSLITNLGLKCKLCIYPTNAIKLLCSWKQKVRILRINPQEIIKNNYCRHSLSLFFWAIIIKIVQTINVKVRATVAVQRTHCRKVQHI